MESAEYMEPTTVKSLPPPLVFPLYITSYEIDIPGPADRDQHNESFLYREDENNNKNLGIEQEIDCPRCHDTMALCSGFYSFGYVCEECDFLLYFNY